MEKECKFCYKIKPLEYFTKHCTSKDGHLYYCKDCLKEYRRIRKIKELEQRKKLTSGEFIQEFN